MSIPLTSDQLDSWDSLGVDIILLSLQMMPHRYLMPRTLGSQREMSGIYVIKMRGMMEAITNGQISLQMSLKGTPEIAEAV